MSMRTVQCKGSGKQIAASVNAKRGFCPVCGKGVDLTGAQKVRKHTRLVTKAQLRKM